MARTSGARSRAAAVQTGDGADVDDHAAAAPVHMRNGGLAGPDHRSRVEVENLIHPGIVRLQNRPPTDEGPRIVDQYIGIHTQTQHPVSEIHCTLF